MIRFLSQPKIQIVLILVITALVYLNILQNGLVWDDHLFIEKWPDIKSFKNIPSLLVGSAPEGQDKIYRPVRSIFYAVNYSLWGANPFFYHLQALFVHLSITVLIYFIAKFLTKKDFIAFSTSLIFGLHPIHTETISYIAASMETFGTLFFFVSFYLYLKSSSLKRGSFLKLTSVFFAAFAFFTYEMTLVLPILILLYEICFNRDFMLKSDKIKVKNPTHFTAYLKIFRLLSFFRIIKYVDFQIIIIRILPFIFPAFLYVYVRIFFLHITSRTEYLGYSFYLTMLTMIKVFARYVFLMILPLRQTINHNLAGDFPASMLTYDKLDPILKQSIIDLDVLLAAVLILGIFVFAIKCFKTNPFITFCITWFFIALLPVSYIVPHGGAMAEKFLYIPSFGFILLLSYGSYRLFLLIPVKFPFQKGLRVFLWLIFIALIFFYSISTFIRNKDWRDDIALFSSVIARSPNNLLANYTLGVWYGEKKEYSKAISYYQSVIKKAPEFWEAHYNLGNIYFKLGKNDLALNEYKKVAKLNPDFIPVKINLENIQKTGDSLNFKNNLFSFSYPKGWEKKEEKNQTEVKDTKSAFTIVFKKDKKKTNVSIDAYLFSQTKAFGTLLNQGLARIPNVDFAYVKIFSDKGINKMQFFLFKEDKVLEVLVYPSDSALMREFDKILGSIKF